MTELNPLEKMEKDALEYIADTAPEIIRKKNEIIADLLEALKKAMIVVALYNQNYPNTVQGIEASDKGYLAIRKAEEQS